MGKQTNKQTHTDSTLTRVQADRSQTQSIGKLHSKLSGGKTQEVKGKLCVCVSTFGGGGIDRMIQKGLTEKVIFEKRSKVRGERAYHEDTW